MQSKVLAGRCCQAADPRPGLTAASRSVTRNFSHTRSHRLTVVATSEFWWEDEQEFDALTEVLLPKQVYIATITGCQQQLQQLKSSTKFAAAFAAPDVQGQVQELWQQLGRSGPPLFLKVRSRQSLQECTSEGANSSAAAGQFWQELTSQSWRTELDYGLALGKDAINAAVDEQVLVVTASQLGVDRLVQAAVGLEGTAGSSCSDIEDVVVVKFEGWNQGATQQQLSSYKQLMPQVQQLAAAQGS